jgi:hypothetical protein
VGGSEPSACQGSVWKVQVGVIACWDFLAAAPIKFLKMLKAQLKFNFGPTFSIKFKKKN